MINSVHEVITWLECFLDSIPKNSPKTLEIIMLSNSRTFLIATETENFAPSWVYFFTIFIQNFAILATKSISRRMYDYKVQHNSYLSHDRIKFLDFLTSWRSFGEAWWMKRCSHKRTWPSIQPCQKSFDHNS